MLTGRRCAVFFLDYSTFSGSNFAITFRVPAGSARGSIILQRLDGLEAGHRWRGRHLGWGKRGRPGGLVGWRRWGTARIVTGTTVVVIISIATSEKETVTIFEFEYS